MRAAIFEAFRGPISITEVADPELHHDGVILSVKANGICRSDWHGWVGHDGDISLPHVPGHEIAGVVEAVGNDVTRWRVGDRVSVPFIAGCGRCHPCRSGDQQVCDVQFQPGFHGWGGFAERVALRHADLTLVGLPETVSFVTAASLGCRFGTSFRAVQAQGRVQPGDWVAIHGCGGVGLSAVMIAEAMGARVIAVDIRDDVLEMAASLGAAHTINANASTDVVEEVRDLTEGGVHVSLDALGSPTTAFNSVANLKKRGRHVQVGLLAGRDRHPPLPMDLLVARELEVVGSHGMQAHEYDRMLRMIADGQLTPDELVTGTVSLEAGVDILMKMDAFDTLGVVVIDQFG